MLEYIIHYQILQKEKDRPAKALNKVFSVPSSQTDGKVLSSFSVGALKENRK